MSVPDYPAGKIIYIPITSRSKASVPMTGVGLAFAVYKDDSTTETTAGVTTTFTSGFDGRAGLINIKIDTSADAFYTTDTDYGVVATAGTVDGESVVGETVARFSIEKQTSSRVNVRAAVGLSSASLTSDLVAIYDALGTVSTQATTIQTGVTAMQATLTTIVGYTDQVETIVTAISGYVDGVESTLATLPATIWNYNFATHAGTVPDYGPINALRAIRNDWSLPIPGTLPGSGTLTVYKEDGATLAYTQSIAFDSNGNITGGT